MVSSSLVVFGALFMVFCAGVILIPYLLRRSDLFTTWNLFILGSGCFVGASAINFSVNQAPYAWYTSADYRRFYLGVVTFYAAVFATYYLFKWPRRLAGKRLRKWPPQTTSVLVLLLPVCAIMSLWSMWPPPIPVLGHVIVQFGPAVAVIALALAFVTWFRSPVNPLLFWTFVGVILYALVFSLFGGTGRRQLVATLATVPICIYWLHFRYRGRLATLVLIGAMLLGGMIIVGAYSTIRHRSRDTASLRKTSFAIESLKMIPSRIASFDTWEFMGQDAVNASLASINFYTQTEQPHPFFTVYYVISNPIPRYLWPSKPEALGQTLPRDLGRWKYGYVNWGPGIIGHGYHEGGVHMLIFYAIVWGSFLRFFDELLVQQPTNPYLLGILCSVAGQIIGWPRGDIGVFTMQIVNGIIAGVMLALLGRLVFGVGLTYPKVTPPQLHSPA